MRADKETFLTIPEVANRLHVSKRWLQGFLSGRPYGRMAGRKRLFTETDVQAIYQELPQCRSTSPRPVRAGRNSGASGGNTSGKALTEVLRLLNERKPKSFSADGKRTSNVVSMPGARPRRSPAQP